MQHITLPYIFQYTMDIEDVNQPFNLNEDEDEDDFI